MDYNLSGKRVLVTGAADGCGKAIALTLAKEGAQVILHDLAMKEELLKANAALCGNGATYLTADLSKAEEVEELSKNAGDLDLLVNNAGIWPTAYVKEMSVAAFNKTLDINLIAPFILCRNFVNQCMEKGKKGKIVNMVSQAAFHGSTSGHAHYAASKAGLVTFTISLAREVAPYGINVNCVAPGMMRTPMNKDALAEREDAYLERIPLRRIADPSEVAAVVAFLCSNQSDYMTGTTLDVTGGMLMR